MAAALLLVLSEYKTVVLSVMNGPVMVQTSAARDT